MLCCALFILLCFPCEHLLCLELSKQFIRQSPATTLLDVRGEAIRWEREGLPVGVRGRSNSVPSAVGFQYVVQGGGQRSGYQPPTSEVGKVKELLRRQQEQLDQLTRSLAQLQSSHQRGHSRGRSPRSGPIICNRCQQPGHIARECDGPRVSSHPQAAARGHGQSRQPSEN